MSTNEQLGGESGQPAPPEQVSDSQSQELGQNSLTADFPDYLESDRQRFLIELGARKERGESADEYALLLTLTTDPVAIRLFLNSQTHRPTSC